MKDEKCALPFRFGGKSEVIPTILVILDKMKQQGCKIPIRLQEKLDTYLEEAESPIDFFYMLNGNVPVDFYKLFHRNFWLLNLCQEQKWGEKLEVAFMKWEHNVGKRISFNLSRKLIDYATTVQSEKYFAWGLHWQTKRGKLYQYLEKELGDFGTPPIYGEKEWEEFHEHTCLQLKSRFYVSWEILYDSIINDYPQPTMEDILEVLACPYSLEPFTHVCFKYFDCFKYLPVETQVRLQICWDMFKKDFANSTCGSVGQKIERFISFCLAEGYGEIHDEGLRGVFTKRLAELFQIELFAKCGDLSDVYFRKRNSWEW